MTTIKGRTGEGGVVGMLGCDHLFRSACHDITGPGVHMSPITALRDVSRLWRCKNLCPWHRVTRHLGTGVHMRHQPIIPDTSPSLSEKRTWGTDITDTMKSDKSRLLAPGPLARPGPPILIISRSPALCPSAGTNITHFNCSNVGNEGAVFTL